LKAYSRFFKRNVSGIAFSQSRDAYVRESALRRTKYLAANADISIEEAKKAIEQDRNSQPNGMPSSVALLGLIPVSIGAAYLVFYYTGNRRDTDSPG
jgi:hypothetical protein